jgi:Fe-S cluster assembly scaffold protein SufB
MSALDDMLAALASVYGDAATLADPRTAHVVVEGNAVVSRQTIPGVELRVQESADRLKAELVIREGARIEAPIHTCIGFLAAAGTQRIDIRLCLEPGASATVLSHCLFPNAQSGSHEMDAGIEIGRGAQLRYREGHYHGLSGGMIVRPRLTVRVGPGARYLSDFSLTTGPVGRLVLRQRIEAGEDAVAEITARLCGRGKDEIRIRDELVLAGRASRGLIKTRIALIDDARAEVLGITRGQAEGARGHMDCLELVRDRAVARAEPIVDVSHPLAKVTHEAAVGTVDQNQLETLMARGLSPEEAIDVIVTGILQ